MVITSRKGVTVARQLLQFIQILCGQTFEKVAEQFQCSTDTVSRHFHNTLTAMAKLARRVIKVTPVPPSLVNDRKFKEFKNVIGALDGSQIPVNFALS